MDFKVKIEQALDELEKLTGEGSTAELRKEIKGSPIELWRRYQTLRETLNELSEEKKDISFRIKMPDEKEMSFPNLETFDAYMMTVV